MKKTKRYQGPLEKLAEDVFGFFFWLISAIVAAPLILVGVGIGYWIWG